MFHNALYKVSKNVDKDKVTIGNSSDAMLNFFNFSPSSSNFWGFVFAQMLN